MDGDSACLCFGTPAAQRAVVTNVSIERQQMKRTHARGWWSRGREESAAERHETILIDQLEWLPQRVLSQLIAPAKNDDMEMSYSERKSSPSITHPAT
jgi:hypothetical protein